MEDVVNIDCSIIVLKVDGVRKTLDKDLAKIVKTFRIACGMTGDLLKSRFKTIEKIVAQAGTLFFILAISVAGIVSRFRRENDLSSHGLSEFAFWLLPKSPRIWDCSNSAPCVRGVL
jgi:hypothetical protein